VAITKDARDAQGQLTGLTYRIGRLGTHCFFGELAVIGAEPTYRIRRRSAQARLQCQISVLGKSVLDELRECYSELDQALFVVEGQMHELHPAANSPKMFSRDNAPGGLRLEPARGVPPEVPLPGHGHLSPAKRRADVQAVAAAYRALDAEGQAEVAALAGWCAQDADSEADLVLRQVAALCTKKLAKSERVTSGHDSARRRIQLRACISRSPSPPRNPAGRRFPARAAEPAVAGSSTLAMAADVAGRASILPRAAAAAAAAVEVAEEEEENEAAPVLEAGGVLARRLSQRREAKAIAAATPTPPGERVGLIELESGLDV
jgi:hypothetical protein